MTPEELNYVFGFVGSLGIGGIVGGLLVFVFLKSFLPSYLSQKATNLATKEDISEITNHVEQIKSQYALLLEASKARHQLRLAAIDKRLEAHQEALRLWRSMYSAVHTSEIGKAVMECQDWWTENCLYLEPEVRIAFSDAYTAAQCHSSYLNDHTNPQLAKNNWEVIIDFPNQLFAAVQLPPLTSTEVNALLHEKGMKPSRS